MSEVDGEVFVSTKFRLPVDEVLYNPVRVKAGDLENREKI